MTVFRPLEEFGELAAPLPVRSHHPPRDSFWIEQRARDRLTVTGVQALACGVGYELQIASVTALALMVPGAVLLLLLERVMEAEYLVFLGRV